MIVRYTAQDSEDTNRIPKVTGFAACRLGSQAAAWGLNR